MSVTESRSTARAIRLVAILNLAYFVIEFGVARAIGSVALFADSIDFLEDASVNFLILFALGWSLRNRSRIGTILAVILLVPGAATLWTAGHKLMLPLTPAPGPLAATAAGALVINFICASILIRHRDRHGSLTMAAFLSARNDVLANLATILAGIVTAFLWRSAWPDLIVGLGIALVNFDAARTVWTTARGELKRSE